MLAYLLPNINKQNSKQTGKKVWVQNCLLKSEQESSHVNILKDLQVQDSKTYRKYLGMNADTFEVVRHH